MSTLDMDRIAEIFNIGLGNAANSLSEMIGQEVHMEYPTCKVVSYSDFIKEQEDKAGVCAVAQTVTGAVNCNATIFFPLKECGQLIRSIIKKKLSEDELAKLAPDAMCEIGNILINACVYSFSEVFNKEFELDIPTFYSTSLDALNSQISGTDTDEYNIVLVSIGLTLPTMNIYGKFIYIFDSDASLAFSKLLAQVGT